ncbi:cyclophilin-like fold protein [Streptomyces sp. NPDC053253]|uniref:cyclophilin-like fold protein n=1 Tax=Streptomyces sp. NPDC053253 TaxID=3365699 RepID=UPI0037D375BC
MKIRLTIDQKPYEAALLDNDGARDFASLRPLTVTMRDLHERERYVDLPRALARGIGQHTFAAVDIAFWRPGPDVAVFYRNEGPSVPDSGIVLLGHVDNLNDAFSEHPDQVTGIFEAAA